MTTILTLAVATMFMHIALGSDTMSKLAVVRKIR